MLSSIFDPFSNTSRHFLNSYHFFQVFAYLVSFCTATAIKRKFYNFVFISQMKKKL